jgi:hypothetical protein
MKGYFQTWHHVAKIRRIKFIGKPIVKGIQAVCGFIGGHEPSKTEWGYGGGDYADSWCRWCNKLIPVPKEELLTRFPGSGQMMNMVGKKIDDKTVSVIRTCSEGMIRRLDDGENKKKIGE